MGFFIAKKWKKYKFLIKPSYPKGVSWWTAVTSIVAIAPWAFVGFDSIPQAAEEFNFSPKKANIIMIIAIVFGGLVYVAINTITAVVMPWQDMINANYDWPTGEASEMIMGRAGYYFLWPEKKHYRPGLEKLILRLKHLKMRFYLS